MSRGGAPAPNPNAQVADEATCKDIAADFKSSPMQMPMAKANVVAASAERNSLTDIEAAVH